MVLGLFTGYCVFEDDLQGSVTARYSGISNIRLITRL